MPTGEDDMRLVGLPGHLKTIEARLLLLACCELAFCLARLTRAAAGALRCCGRGCYFAGAALCWVSIRALHLHVV